MSNTKKEQYIIDNFKLEEKIVKSISEIGRIVGTNKYDIWIAKEVKKDNKLINNTKEFQYIIDWVKNEKPNLMELTFDTALANSETWHKSLTFKEDVKNDPKVEEEDERVIYRCSDKKHFFLLLFPEDLENEGNIMKNCVGGYKDKVRSGRSLILSLRDENNESHTTIEVDTQSGLTTQIRGKANTDPSKKYQKLITEFAIFATGYNDSIDKEISELINLKFE